MLKIHVTLFSNDFVNNVFCNQLAHGMDIHLF